MGWFGAVGDALGAIAGTVEGNAQVPEIIAMSPGSEIGYRRRELMAWRVPGIGFVQMYINPQSLKIDDKKIIPRERTKGGFSVQYWGEDVTTLTISGTTGTAGIDGINILKKVYRSEQETYQLIANQLASNLESYKQSSIDSREIQSVISDVQETSSVPTLGSLALSVELYYQGAMYKGYFESFSVEEKVDLGPGVFSYDMVFISLENKGFRTNFMPWHRKAEGGFNHYNNANSKFTPYTFKGEKNT